MVENSPFSSALNAVDQTNFPALVIWRNNSADTRKNCILPGRKAVFAIVQIEKSTVQ